MPTFLQNLLALPAKTKALVAVSGVAILAIAVLMLKLATAPSYALLASGMDPSQTGKVTTALDTAGISYKLGGNGTSLSVNNVADGPGADRAGLGRRQPVRQLAARLRAVRQEQAGLLAVPAAGDLPACAGGPARQHDRRRPGRAERHGAARAAAGRPVRRPAVDGHRRGHAGQLGRHARLRRRARHRAAHRLLGQGPEGRRTSPSPTAPASCCGPRATARPPAASAARPSRPPRRSSTATSRPS